MKTLFFNFFAIIAIVSFSSCKNETKEAATKDAEKVAITKLAGEAYRVDTDNSMIKWTGSKPTGSHSGTIAIKEGKLNIGEHTIKNGKFAIDMNSIVVSDIPVEDEGNAKLTAHLKSADFFNAEKYPMALFEITGAKTVNGKTILSGNLTLKDITNNISFTVKTSINDGTLTLKSETFTIDRSKWNVEYASKSFFDNLGDKFIYNDIELNIILVANKA